MSDASQGPGWWQATDGKWYAPQPPPTQAVKKKFYKRVWFWLLVVLVVIVGGCISIVTTASVVIHKIDTTKHTVIYSVTGDGSASITYDTFTNGSTGSSQNSGVALPWTKTVVGTGIFSIYSVVAQIQSGSTVTCTITVDGKKVATNTSTGQYAIATCGGTS